MDKYWEILSDNLGKETFFNVSEEFFIIDSKSLGSVKTKLYGYSVQKTGIYENDNLTPEGIHGMDGCGCYVYVEVKDDKIKIRQDFNGSYGIYVYVHDDYFAISNSFFRLLDHVKCKYPISLNRDYANMIMVDGLTSLSYSETAVNEIELLGKNVVLTIDCKQKSLFREETDYKENTYSLNSAEGIRILDEWYEKWTGIFRKLKNKTDNMMVALSGGFDSRITFLLMLKSGINLNEIRVDSYEDKLHTHSEDYEIATSIANHFGFKLNNKELSKDKMVYGLEDIINMSFYTKMTFHKEMYYRKYKYSEKRYTVPGSGGEAVRAHWDISAGAFREQIAGRGKRYSVGVANEIYDSVTKIINKSYEEIGKKFNINDSESIEYPLNLYRETRCRNHFGKGAVENFFTNEYMLTPLLDPALVSLKPNDDDCNDNNLLMALIYVRYCPELLDFKFEGNRSISLETIRHAEMINNNFPVNTTDFVNAPETEDFVVDTKGYDESKCITDDKNRIADTLLDKSIDAYLKRAFDSSSFRKLFATYFDEELYSYAQMHFKNNNFFPMRECYSIMGITRIIQDIMAGECIMRPTIVKGIDGWINGNHYTVNDAGNISESFRNFVTARFDIRLSGVENPDLDIVSVSDSKVVISKPEWIQKDGRGYVLESLNAAMDVVLFSESGGKLTINLKSRDVRDKNGEKISYWIDYTKCLLNGKNVFNDVRTAWHDKPAGIACSLKAGETVKLHVEWMPAKYEPVENNAEYNDNKALINTLKDYLTARFDIRLSGVENPDLDFVSMSDKSAGVTKPGWLQKGGVGYVVESYNGTLDFVLTSKSGGKLDIRLKSRDVRDEAGNRILYWFDFNNCMYDGEPLFDEPKKACHDREIILSRQMMPDTAIRFHVEWKPAKYEG